MAIQTWHYHLIHFNKYMIVDSIVKSGKNLLLIKNDEKLKRCNDNQTSKASTKRNNE